MNSKGYLPLNPIGQNVEGVSYPFDLLKTKALEYFSKTLPILKADDTLPKVAKSGLTPNNSCAPPFENLHPVIVSSKIRSASFACAAFLTFSRKLFSDIQNSSAP